MMVIANANIANAGRHLKHGAVANHGEALTDTYKLFPGSLSSEITRCSIHIHSRLVLMFSK